MGIFGLGSMREHFTKRSFVVAGYYAACLDVTSAVVYALRNCANTDHFEFIFRGYLLKSREVNFLKKYPPAVLCYTLDNGSPKSKRQTQEARKMDSQVPMLRALALQEQQGRLLIAPSFLHNENSANVAVIEPKPRLRISQVASDVRRVLLSDQFRPSTECDVVFDYECGEGEVKAIRWLYAQTKWPLKLVMSRDNDVFVYALSVLQHQTVDSPEKLLVFHESSDSVLACWTHLTPRHKGASWILLLWMSICFGNDYTHGILQKSISDVGYHFELLQKHFLDYKTAKYHDDLFRILDNSNSSRDQRFVSRPASSSSLPRSGSFGRVESNEIGSGDGSDEDSTMSRERNDSAVKENNTRDRFPSHPSDYKVSSLASIATVTASANPTGGSSDITAATINNSPSLSTNNGRSENMRRLVNRNYHGTDGQTHDRRRRRRHRRRYDYHCADSDNDDDDAEGVRGRTMEEKVEDTVNGADVLTAVIVQLQRILRGQTKSSEEHHDDGGSGDEDDGKNEDRDSDRRRDEARAIGAGYASCSSSVNATEVERNKLWNNAWKVHRTRRGHYTLQKRERTRRSADDSSIVPTALIRSQRRFDTDDDGDGDYHEKRKRKNCDVYRDSNDNSCGARNSDNDNVKEESKGANSALIRAWIGRHLWSLLYIAELPVKFRHNECFTLCPKVLIDADFAMPHISRAKFLGLSENTIRRELRYVLSHGIASEAPRPTLRVPRATIAAATFSPNTTANVVGASAATAAKSIDTAVSSVVTRGGGDCGNDAMSSITRWILPQPPPLLS